MTAQSSHSVHLFKYVLTYKRSFTYTYISLFIYSMFAVSSHTSVFVVNRFSSLQSYEQYISDRTAFLSFFPSLNSLQLYFVEI